MNSKSLLPWLQLVRLPAVFTALADICAGYLLTHREWKPLPDFLCLLGASATLYLSGMVFNDVFDREQDLRERPHRPIPSGNIALRPAVMLGSLLMLTGLGASAFVGKFSLLGAGLLILAILAYDGILKRTMIGPLSMGLCRFLNVLLGASAGAESLQGLFSMPQLWVAASMGLYVTGVTLFARSEARTSRRSLLLSGLLVLDAGLVLLLLWMLDVPRRMGWESGPVGADDALPMLLFWGIVTISLNRRALGAIYEPTPASVQPAIGSMLLSIITLDAMIIYFRLGPPGLHLALLTLALIAPAVLMRRWISMT